ncbi:uncharacterized protein C8A04DRAFT_23963 [Dichotomopilus funicola]|uniref:Uncharacterized protein n=1 Tax=Dichotomopilus funicola TaxID=1934379 RepID=A0AAN6VB97_9PEZI|nr:hypothetical protein C8A04DRAFT_23963 [Dichotomopilus funicola]
MSEPILEKQRAPSHGPDYKAQLDEIADREKGTREDQTQAQESSGASGVINKAVSKVLGSQEKPESKSPLPKDVPGPPDRPANDTQVEEFLKDQHRSRKILGIEDPTDTDPTAE